jgi:hypothetical protein
MRQLALFGLWFWKVDASLGNVSLVDLSPHPEFNNPTAIKMSSNGHFALLADQGNHIIRHLILSTSTLTTLVGLSGSAGSKNGIGSNARFNLPIDLCITTDSLVAYVADYSNHVIRQIILSTSLVTTLGGLSESFGSLDGIGTRALFNFPAGLTVSSDQDGGEGGGKIFVLVADSANHIIRIISTATGEVNTLVGRSGINGNSNGYGTNARFSSPTGISLSPNSLFALVSDSYNHLLRHIMISTGEVKTLVGSDMSSGSMDGIGTIAQFYYPSAVSLSSDGVYALVADRYNQLIRHILISTATVSSVAGWPEATGVMNGIGTNALLAYPTGVSLSYEGSFALIADTSNNLIRRLELIDNPTLQPTSPPTPRPTLFPTRRTVSPTLHQPTTLPSANQKHHSLAHEPTPTTSGLSTPSLLLTLTAGIVWVVIAVWIYMLYRRNQHTLRSPPSASSSESDSSSHPLTSPVDGIQMSMTPVDYSPLARDSTV